jgi:hypothetical protein
MFKIKKLKFLKNMKKIKRKKHDITTKRCNLTGLTLNLLLIDHQFEYYKSQDH